MSLARNISKVSADSNGYIQPASLTSVDGSIFSSRVSPLVLPSGSSIQMVSMIYQWYNSINMSQSWQNVPNMSISITPRYANSKIRVDVKWFGESVDAWNTVFGINRNGTMINLPSGYSNRNPALGMPCQTYIANDNNSTPELCNITTLDSPGTTATLTYNLQVMCDVASRTIFTGRVFDASVGGSNYEQGTCEMVLTEFAP